MSAAQIERALRVMVWIFMGVVWWLEILNSAGGRSVGREFAGIEAQVQGFRGHLRPQNPFFIRFSR